MNLQIDGEQGSGHQGPGLPTSLKTIHSFPVHTYDELWCARGFALHSARIVNHPYTPKLQRYRGLFV